MDTIRSDNVKRNIVASIINKALSLLVPFLVRVVMIHKLGAEYLGLDSLVISILQVLNLTEFGFSQAIMVCMYRPIANNDMETLSALTVFYRRLYRIIGLVILVIGVAIMPFLPLLIRSEIPDDISIFIVYGLFLLNTVLSYFLFAYKQTLLSAYQRQDLISNINSVAKMVMYSMQLVALWVSSNYYYYVVAIFLLTIISNISNSVFADRMVRIDENQRELQDSTRSEIMFKVKGLFINKVCIVSRNAFDSIFISAFIGLIAAAMYSNYYYVLSALISLTAVIKNSILASVGNSIAIDTKEKNYIDMMKLNFLYMWIFGWMTVCALCLYQRFIGISFGATMLFPSGVMVLLCVYFYVLMMGDIRSVYVEATGIWWEGRYRAVAEAVANLVLNFVLGKLFGIYGIIIATLISLFVFNFLWGSNIIFKHYFTQTTSVEYFKLHGFYALVTFLACVVTYFVTTRVTSILALDGIPAMVVILAICIILPNLIYMAVYRRTRIYKESIGWLGRVTGWERYEWWKVFGAF